MTDFETIKADMEAKFEAFEDKPGGDEGEAPWDISSTDDEGASAAAKAKKAKKAAAKKAKSAKSVGLIGHLTGDAAKKKAAAAAAKKKAAAAAKQAKRAAAADKKNAIIRKMKRDARQQILITWAAEMHEKVQFALAEAGIDSEQSSSSTDSEAEKQTAAAAQSAVKEMSLAERFNYRQERMRRRVARHQRHFAKA